MHSRCSSSVHLAKYNECVNSGEEIAFVCDNCGLSSLPFANEEEVGNGVGTAEFPAMSAQQVSMSSTSVFQSCPIPHVLSLKGLHFLHANVRSLLPKISEVHLLLSRTKAAVFAVSELWLDSTVGNGEV